VGFHPLKTNREKDPSPKRSQAKNSEENLEKDSPHVLFVFAWYEERHCIRPEIVVQLVNTGKLIIGIYRKLSELKLLFSITVFLFGAISSKK
jgi:hypothetical protein